MQYQANIQRNSQKSFQSATSIKKETSAEKLQNLKENTVDNILKAKNKDKDEDTGEITRESKIISNGSQLGVNGIDVPISGSCSGKNSSFHKVHEKRIREDRIKTQVTVSDMIAKIRNIES